MRLEEIFAEIFPGSKVATGAARFIIPMGANHIDVVTDQVTGNVSLSWRSSTPPEAKFQPMKLQRRLAIIDEAVVSNDNGLIGWFSFVRMSLTQFALKALKNAVQPDLFLPTTSLSLVSEAVQGLEILHDVCGLSLGEIAAKLAPLIKITWYESTKGNWGFPVESCTSARKGAIGIKPQDDGRWFGRMRVMVRPTLLTERDYPGNVGPYDVAKDFVLIQTETGVNGLPLSLPPLADGTLWYLTTAIETLNKIRVAYAAIRPPAP